jgi:DNA-directed RNA polymerase specialized sigma24 family protein
VPDQESKSREPVVAVDLIRAFLQQHEARLMRTLRLYVRTAGIVPSSSVDDEATDLLASVTVCAIEGADGFDATRNCEAWLLGIAVNLLRQRKDRLIKQQTREPFVRT